MNRVPAAILSARESSAGRRRARGSARSGEKTLRVALVPPAALEIIARTNWASACWMRGSVIASCRTPRRTVRIVARRAHLADQVVEVARGPLQPISTALREDGSPAPPRWPRGDPRRRARLPVAQVAEPHRVEIGGAGVLIPLLNRIDR
jgi:hypothetical protein